jgi:hypothetical protein
MNVMKSVGVGAAAGAALGGIAVIPYLSLIVIADVFTKSLFHSLMGRSDQPYTFNENLVSEHLVLKSVCIGIVLGSLAGLVSAVVTNCFFYAYNRGKTS